MIKKKYKALEILKKLKKDLISGYPHFHQKKINLN